MSEEKRYRITELHLEPDVAGKAARKFTLKTDGVEVIQVDTPGVYTIWYENGKVLNIVSPSWTAFIYKEEAKQPLILVPELMPPKDVGNAT